MVRLTEEPRVRTTGPLPVRSLSTESVVEAGAVADVDGGLVERLGSVEVEQAVVGREIDRAG